MTGHSTPSSIGIGDDVIVIKKFEQGRELTKQDIDFLQMVTKSDSQNSPKKWEVTINAKNYTAGYKITAKDAQLIAKLTADYAKTHPSVKTRGVGGCPCNCCWSWVDSTGKNYQICCN